MIVDGDETDALCGTVATSPDEVEIAPGEKESIVDDGVHLGHDTARQFDLHSGADTRVLQLVRGAARVNRESSRATDLQNIHLYSALAHESVPRWIWRIRADCLSRQRGCRPEVPLRPIELFSGDLAPPRRYHQSRIRSGRWALGNRNVVGIGERCEGDQYCNTEHEEDGPVAGFG